MADNTQNYSNHVRWHTPFHFILVPIISIHLLWCLFRLYQNPDLDHAEQLLLAIGLLIMMFLTRINAIRVQDRLIRLEEWLRYDGLLPAEFAEQASKLPVRYIAALRFASDEELSELIQQVIDGKFAKPDDLKKAIKNWRADHLRV